MSNTNSHNEQPQRGEPATDRTVLSAQGSRRREEILGNLQHALARRQGRRRAARSTLVGSTALLLLAAGLYIAGIWRGAPPAPDRLVADAPDTSIEALPDATDTTKLTAPRSLVEIVRDNPNIVERLTAAPQPSRVITINDDELLDLLARAGKPDGLIRTSQRVMLSSEFRTALREGTPLDGF